MEPQIQYCKTSDGVSIACWALGSGPPLVYLPPMPGHVMLEWESSVFGNLYRSIAERYRLIRLDFRNSGLSQRLPNSPMQGSEVLDMEAVADRLDVDQFSIWAQGLSGHAAITFAAQRPERIDALILSECFVAFADIADVGQVQALASLCARDYGTFTETMGNIFFGWDAQLPAREFATLLRASVTHEQMIEGMRQFVQSDVSGLLAGVRARTLVLHHRNAQLVPQEATTKLASAIAGARLVLLEGETVAGPLNDPAEKAVIDELLLGHVARARPAHATTPSGTAVILFADIADSTSLTERMGDTAFRSASRALDAALRDAVKEAGGVAVDGKLLGDGVLATFPSAAQAIDAARRFHELSAASELRLHLGIHAGDVIREDGNLFGGAVNIASRICELSSPGEILVSDVVRGMARTSAGVEFEDRGEQEMKGVGEPVRLYRVR